jgi:hypothetical protein
MRQVLPTRDLVELGLVTINRASNAVPAEGEGDAGEEREGGRGRGRRGLKARGADAIWLCRRAAARCLLQQNFSQRVDLDRGGAAVKNGMAVRANGPQVGHRVDGACPLFRRQGA